MPSIDSDEFGQAGAPRRSAHEIGQVLDLLSIEEIEERIALLRAEIERLEAQRSMKAASRRAADAFFKS